MSTLKVSTISPLGTDATKTITVGASGDTFTVTDGVTVSGAGSNTPAFYAYKTSDQSVSNDTTTKITFDATLFDSSGGFSLTDNKFTVPTGGAGKYQINTNFFLYDSSGDLFRVDNRIYKNGNMVFNSLMYKDNNADSFRFFSSPVTQYMDLAVGDYLEMYLYAETNDSGAITVQSNTADGEGKWNFISGQRVIGA
jgi:hypothetical protein|tara:strand:+ start:187 stop:774 length:588 start_codon:yes stop_codon:yes gene_type:complete